MSGRVFEVVGSSKGSVNVSSEELVVHGFDGTMDKLKTVLVTIAEGSAVPCTNADDSVVVLSALDSQTYLKLYQIVSLPNLVIRTTSAENSPFTVIPVTPEGGSVAEGSDSTEEVFAAAIAAYNEFNMALAIDRFEEVLTLDPLHKQALFNLASILHMLDFPTLAVGYTLRLLTIDPDDVIAHSFLWALNNTGQCSAAAVQAYRLLASRGDLRAATKLATLTGQGSQAVRGDPTYAQQIYDDMGESFETKLVDHLGYRGPWLMREMLEALIQNHTESSSATDSVIDSAVDKALTTAGDRASAAQCDIVSDLSTLYKLRPKGDWRILDVGCGSGLCGEIFADYVRPKTALQLHDVSSVAEESLPPAPPAPAPQVSLLTLKDVPHTAGGLMVGIDVSAKMVEITARKGVYHCAERWDLTAALRALDCRPSAEDNTEDNAVLKCRSAEDKRIISPLPRIGLDMVIAADTFIYVGALGEVFSLVHKVLRESGGLFMFSTEDLELSPMRVQTAANHAQCSEAAKVNGGVSAAAVDSSGACMINTSSVDSSDVDSTVVDSGSVHNIGDSEIAGAVPGWGAQLLKSARFAHSDAYIRMLCEKHRFAVLEHRRIVLRTEETIPLPGTIYILQKL